MSLTKSCATLAAAVVLSAGGALASGASAAPAVTATPAAPAAAAGAVAPGPASAEACLTKFRVLEKTGVYRYHNSGQGLTSLIKYKYRGDIVTGTYNNSYPQYIIVTVPSANRAGYMRLDKVQYAGSAC